MLKSLRFVPFGANLTQFGWQIWHPCWDYKANVGVSELVLNLVKLARNRNYGTFKTNFSAQRKCIKNWHSKVTNMSQKAPIWLNLGPTLRPLQKMTKCERVKVHEWPLTPDPAHTSGEVHSVKHSPSHPCPSLPANHTVIAHVSLSHFTNNSALSIPAHQIWAFI